MLDIIVLFSAGMLAGLVTALPIGPTNLWLAQSMLPPAKPFRNILSFIVGLIFLDAFYASLAFWGYTLWIKESGYNSAVGLAAGAGLLAIGIAGLLSFAREPKLETRSSEGAGAVSCVKDFLFGLLLGSNPAYIAYWIGVARMAESYGSIDLGPWNFYLIFAGIVLGDVLWYSLFLLLLKRVAVRISPVFARRSRVLISLVFIVFGLMVLREFSI